MVWDSTSEESGGIAKGGDEAVTESATSENTEARTVETCNLMSNEDAELLCIDNIKREQQNDVDIQSGIERKSQTRSQPE